MRKRERKGEGDEKERKKGNPVKSPIVDISR